VGADRLSSVGWADRSPDISVLSGSKYGFKSPIAIDSDGTHVWVANTGGYSVTELSATTGALVQVISGSSYGFVGPYAISSDGSDVWVANYAEQSVSVFPT
jgi:DNA-binding beta-propeller fold protein YncE